MSVAGRIAKNTGWLYAKTAVTSIISLLTTRFILNSLGQSDYGIYNLVGGAIAMLGFINAALASTTQRFLNYSEGEGDQEKKKSIFNVSIILHLSIAVIMVLILTIASFVFFGGVLNVPDQRVGAAVIIYKCLVFSTAITIISAPLDAVITSHENMKFYAIVGLIESTLKLTVALVCVYTSSDKLIVYGVLMALIPVITLSIMLWYCRSHYAECVWSPRRYFSMGYFKEIGGFAGWNLAMTTTSMATQYGFGIVLNSFFGVLLNAAQGIAVQLSGMLQTVSSLAQKAYNPVLVKRVGSGDNQGAKYLSFTGCRVSFLLFGAVSVPAIILMPELLKLWLGNVPEWAVIFSRFQLLRILLEQLVSGMSPAILASGKIKKYAILMSVSYILPILVLPILFSLGFKPYWMYIVWIFFWNIISGTLSVHFMNINYGKSTNEYLFSVLLPCTMVTAGSLLPYLVSIILHLPDMLIYLSVLIQMVTFLFLGWMFVLHKNEREQISNVFYSKIRRSFGHYES